MVTINPEIVQFIRHLALTGHLTVMYKDSTNIGVNLTKGESFLTPKRMHNLFSKMEFYEFVCICMSILITSPFRPPNLFEDYLPFDHSSKLIPSKRKNSVCDPTSNTNRPFSSQTLV